MSDNMGLEDYLKYLVKATEDSARDGDDEDSAPSYNPHPKEFISDDSFLREFLAHQSNPTTPSTSPSPTRKPSWGALPSTKPTVTNQGAWGRMKGGNNR